MNWRTTGTVLLVVGALAAAGGAIWYSTLQSEANNCRIKAFGKLFADCPTTTTALVAVAAGVGIAVLAVALLAGAKGNSEG